jgi:hypothetical protein
VQVSVLWTSRQPILEQLKPMFREVIGKANLTRWANEVLGQLLLPVRKKRRG